MYRGGVGSQLGVGNFDSDLTSRTGTEEVYVKLERVRLPAALERETEVLLHGVENRSR